MKHRTIIGGLASGCILLAGCQTTQSDDQDKLIVIGPDGKAVAMDQDGEPINDPSLQALAELLSEIPQESNESPDLPDDMIWDVDEQGNYRHIQSGGICPAVWGDLYMTRPIIFQQDGSDVGCNYQSETPRVLYTFYFYRAIGTLEGEMAENIKNIKLRVPTSEQVDIALFGGPTYLYIAAGVESTNSTDQKVRDSLLMTDQDGWRIKLRMTYPASYALDYERLGGIMLTGQRDQVMLPPTPADTATEQDGPKITT